MILFYAKTIEREGR